MIEFFCQQCADKSDELESLTLGAIGIHECSVCGRKVDAMNESYSFFRDGAKARLEAKEEALKTSVENGAVDNRQNTP